jgi:hypothetical protein
VGCTVLEYQENNTLIKFQDEQQSYTIELADSVRVDNPEPGVKRVDVPRDQVWRYVRKGDKVDFWWDEEKRRAPATIHRISKY